MPVVEEVLGHPIDLLTVARHLLVEDTSPHQGVQFVLWAFGRSAINEKVEVQVSSNRIQVIVDVLDLFEFPEHIHIFHLLGDHFVKAFK